MKKLILFVMCIGLFAVAGCQNRNIGIIGGADGPTNIIVSEHLDKIGYEKSSVKMIRLNGTLYYETGKNNNTVGRCAVMDGNFMQTVSKYEIPRKDNESNFDGANSYQSGMKENTIEVFIEDEWKVFAKIDTEADILQYQYCYELKGRLPNASSDSVFLVLADEENITFDDAAYTLLGSDLTEMKDIYVLAVD